MPAAAAAAGGRGGRRAHERAHLCEQRLREERAVAAPRVPRGQHIAQQKQRQPLHAQRVCAGVVVQQPDEDEQVADRRALAAPLAPPGRAAARHEHAQQLVHVALRAAARRAAAH